MSLYRLCWKKSGAANPSADVTILIATGCHRGTTKEELIAKFGEEIVRREKIYIHDCDETEKYVNIGTLPSGGECVINELAAKADLLVAEGFIEPHFFAGYSGGARACCRASAPAAPYWPITAQSLFTANTRAPASSKTTLSTRTWSGPRAKRDWLISSTWCINAEKKWSSRRRGYGSGA